MLYASSAQAASGFVAGKDGMLSVPEASPLRSQIQVAAVQVGMPRDTLTVPGNIAAEPRRIFPLLPPVTGRILSVSATPGQHVVRGQELVRIMSGDMAQAVTDQEKAEAGLLMARSAMVRAQEVRKAGGAATKDVEAAHAALLDAPRLPYRVETLHKPEVVGGVREQECAEMLKIFFQTLRR